MDRMNYTVYEYGQPIAMFAFEVDVKRYAKQLRELEAGKYISEVDLKYKFEVKGHEKLYNYGDIISCNVPKPLLRSKTG